MAGNFVLFLRLDQEGIVGNALCCSSIKNSMVIHKQKEWRSNGRHSIYARCRSGSQFELWWPPDPVTLAQMDNGPDFIGMPALSMLVSTPKISRFTCSQYTHTVSSELPQSLWAVAESTDWLRAVEDHVQHVKSPWLAQDVSVCFVKEPGYSIQLGYFVSCPVKKSLTKPFNEC